MSRVWDTGSIVPSCILPVLLNILTCLNELVYSATVLAAVIRNSIGLWPFGLSPNGAELDYPSIGRSLSRVLVTMRTG